MLYIYSALALGGVETFFVRMARERAIKGLSTKILLLAKPQKSDSELLAEMKKYADVYFSEDIFIGFSWFIRSFPLLSPIKKGRLEKLFDGVSQVHVYGGMHALLAYRLRMLANNQAPITVGFYHYLTYVWGGNDVAYYERQNRRFVFDYLPARNLLFFSLGNRKFHEECTKLKFNDSSVFRLGVVNAGPAISDGGINNPIRICAVGRLVAFKSYNLYMLDVVKRLNESGFNVVFDVYGDGPLKSAMEARVDELRLTSYVSLKGRLDYSCFDDVVGVYDLFIGSGTAVIQAASLGVPSIAAVENVLEPMTYGFFSDVHQYEYNLDGLGLPMYNVYDMLVDYIRLTPEQRKELKNKHVNSIKAFTNETCQRNMDALKSNSMPDENFKFNRWWYEFTRFIDWFVRKTSKRHPYNTRFKNFRS